MPSDPMLIYILAASHSGSTLTAMLLNAHPDICTAGELKATNLGDPLAYRCSCHRLIGECGFWSEVAAEMGRRGLEYQVTRSGTSLRAIRSAYVRRLLAPLHRGLILELARDCLLSVSPVWRHAFSDWKRQNLALIQSIGSVTGSRYVADSSKIGIRLKYLNRIDGLRIKVLRVIRDGRGVCLTYMNPSDFADAKDPGLRGGGVGAQAHPCLSMRDAATEWLRSNQEAERVLGTMPREDCLQIHYEALCEKTDVTMNKIHSFLGVRDDTSYRNFREIENHVVGNGMRLDSDSRIVLDERWRDQLNAAELAEFDAVAGKLNRSYGYR